MIEHVPAMWEYQSPTTILAPYDAKYFPSLFLFQLYQRLVDQELLDIIFPGMNFSTVNQFVRYMDSHPCLMGFARKDGVIVDLAGIAYLTETDGIDGARKAGFGFGFFREWHATKEARILSWFYLAMWLHDLKIDVLFGTTLKSNRLARNFSYNFGFKNHVDLPKLFFRNGQLEDATIMLLERSDFDDLYYQFREEYIPEPMEAAVRG